MATVAVARVNFCPEKRTGSVSGGSVLSDLGASPSDPLPLWIGQKVEVLSTSHGSAEWCYGRLVDDHAVSGIFPARFVESLPSCSYSSNNTPAKSEFAHGAVDRGSYKSEGDVSMGRSDPLMIAEISDVLVDWWTACKRAYAVSGIQGLQRILSSIEELVAVRRRTITGNLPKDELKEIRSSVARRIDTGNSWLGLDMVIRDENGRAIRADSVHLIRAYKRHKEAAEQVLQDTAIPLEVRAECKTRVENFLSRTAAASSSSASSSKTTTTPASSSSAAARATETVKPELMDVDDTCDVVEMEEIEEEGLIFSQKDGKSVAGGNLFLQKGNDLTREQLSLKSAELSKEFERTRQQSDGYMNMLKIRQTLPAFQSSDHIMKTVSENMVTIVCGDTGCGKSTQVPQMILDQMLDDGTGAEACILVTEPRRISATSLASRVAAERGEQLGKSVGYQIRLEVVSPRPYGSIMYCTHGVALQWMLGDPQLSRVTHLIIDEVHERNVDSDFLIILARDLLLRRPDMKIILMSATINADFFVNYFQRSSEITVAKLEISGRLFPVEAVFLEDVIDKLNYKPAGNTRSRRKPPADLKMLPGENKRDAMARHQKVIGSFLNFLRHHRKYHPKTLTTLESWDEEALDTELIMRLCENLCKQAFHRCPLGVRKIVVATNIAETSITIDDVVYVIDTGRIKMTSYDPACNIQTLKPEWYAQANMRQRRGRAGRVRSGQCFHLFMSYRLEDMPEHLDPEMRRTRLESIILRVKHMNLGPVLDFLQKAPDVPEIEIIDRALDELRGMGALTADEKLTALGEQLVHLPVDPLLGKAMLYAVLFKCLEPVLTVIAVLEHKDPFYRPMGKEDLVDRLKLELSQGSGSDYLLWIKVCGEFESRKRDYGAGEAYNYADQNFLSGSVIQHIDKLKHQFARLLHSAGFIEQCAADSPEANSMSENTSVVSAVLSAGLCPRIARTRLPVKRHSSLYSKGWKSGKIGFGSVNCNDLSAAVDTGLVSYFKGMRHVGGVRLYDSSRADPLVLALFSGQLKIEYPKNPKVKSSAVCLVCDEWLWFITDPKSAELVVGIRKKFQLLLEKSVTNARVGFSSCDDDSALISELWSMFVAGGVPYTDFYHYAKHFYVEGGDSRFFDVIHVL